MKTIAIAALALAVLAAGGYGAYRLGMDRGMKMGEASPASGRKVLYWHDPMVPGQKFDKPGKSPFMDMPLVPVYEDSEAQGGVTIDPRMQQSLGVRTAEARKVTLAPSIEAVGNVAYNERESAVVQARSNGFVERLYARASLDPVRKGQALAELYVPDWVAAQEEYLSVRRMQGTRMEALVDGARQRMRLAGMSEEQIRTIESTGKVHPRLTITAPMAGVIAELGAREGMTVMPGAMLFRISGLDTVWVNAELRESEAAQVRPGTIVEARAAALPERVFKGKVSAILPEVNATTRTLKARVELANPGTALKPGMFVTVDFTPSARRETLVVPSEAVIRTGTRAVVIVAQGEGKFAPAEVETGVEANGETEIRKGVEAGEKVVLSGQFLIDSEASLRGALTRMGEPQAAGAYKAKGKVESIGRDEVMLSHEPIPALKWPAMTMGFKPPAAGLPADIGVGDTVEFEFRQGASGQFEISAMAKVKP